MSPAAPGVNPFVRKAPARGLLRWLPGLRLPRTYQRTWLAKDVFAGLVLGPESALAGLIAAAILPLAGGVPERAVALAGMLALLSGGLCIVAGLARFGFITKLRSKPIRYGYLNGIALTVLIGQLPKLLGFSVPGDRLLQRAAA
jgi:MFS superfamily sulfate permease-like transporter